MNYLPQLYCNQGSKFRDLYLILLKAFSKRVIFTKMLQNKNIKNFINYFLGPVLFIWLSWSIYHQVKSQYHLEESWKHIKSSFYSYNIFYLIGAILLIPVNWGLEALKWKRSVSFIY